MLAALLAVGCGGQADGDSRPGTSTEAQARADVAGRIRAGVEAVDAEGLPGLGRSIWIGLAQKNGRDGDPVGAEPLFEEEAHVPRPAASSIKTAYLVELFAERSGRLDEPLPGAVETTGDPAHPAIAHFDEATQADIRSHLEAASVRRVGRAMIRGDDVTNAVYNAAANLTTSWLGGPETLTARIHDRHPDFDGIHARRYMLAARDVTGDNEATASSLAAVLGAIARGDLPGVSDGTLEAIRQVLFLDEDEDGSRHWFKGGSLNSDPLARILSGILEPSGNEAGVSVVYVIMAETPGPPDGVSREDAGQRLMKYVEAVRDAALPAALDAARATSGQGS